MKGFIYNWKYAKYTIVFILGFVLFSMETIAQTTELSVGPLSNPSNLSPLETDHGTPSAPQLTTSVAFDFNIVLTTGTRLQFNGLDLHLNDIGIDWEDILEDVRIDNDRFSGGGPQAGTIVNSGFGGTNNTIIQFTGIPNTPNAFGDINVNEGKTFQVRLRFRTNIDAAVRSLIDGQNISISVSESDFGITSGAFTSAGTISSGNIPIEVTATEYRINSEPATVQLNSNFGLTVEAVDANGNRDLDQTSVVTLARGAGSGILSSGSGLANNLVSGVFTWSDIQINANSIFDIVASGSLTSATSNSIDVIPSIVSVTPPSNDTYANSENLDFTVEFDESVTLTGSPRIAITVDAGGSEFATYVTGPASTSHTFRYTVDNNDLDTDGIVIVSPLDLNSGTIEDSGGNDAILAFSLPNTSSVNVDGVRPSITSVSVTDNTYEEGDNLDISVLFDEVVNVTGTPRIQFTMESGGTVNADYQSGDGTSTLNFRYQIQAGDNDVNGIVINSPIQPNGGTITDANTNDAILTFSLPNTTGVLVDAQDPTITSFSLPTDDTYVAGENLEFQVDYDEIVQVTGTPRIQLTLNTGGSVFANYFSGDNTASLTFRYTVMAGNEDPDGITVNSTIDLNSGTIEDNVGRTADLNYSVGTTSGILVDATIPNILSITPPSNDTYINGENIDITVNFSESVDITNTPRIPITIASGSVFANYQSGSGSSSIIFRYQVQSGDEDTDGIIINSPIQLNLGTIQDGGGNNSALSFTPPATPAVLIDAVLPSITSVTPPANGTYGFNFLMDFTVVFDDIITVNNTPRIRLNLNSGIVFANYLSGSGSNTLVFRYIVGGVDEDDNGITMVSPLQQNGGSLLDGAGNAANLTYTLPNTSLVFVDGVAPRISSITRSNPTTSPTNANTVEWDVNFDQPVFNVDVSDFTVSGAGNIQSVSGVGNTYTIIVSGGGLSNFNGTVTLGIDGGIDITDSNGNSFSNFTPTGTNNNTFVMDNTPPGLPSVPDLAAGSDSFGGETNSNGNNSDNVTNDNMPTFNGTAENGSTVEIRSALTGTIIGSGIASGGNYSITTVALADGVHGISARATDPQGNMGNFSGELDVTIDTQSPQIQGDLVFADNGGDRETVTFTFNEPIDLNNNTVVQGFTSSTNSVRAVGSRYFTAGNEVRLQSNNNNGWTITTTLDYANGSGNIRDLAGNELATQVGLVTQDNTPPSLITGIQFLPNGNGPEQIIFNLSEEINVAEGGTVNGFYVNGLPVGTAAFSTAIYSSKANNNIVTLTSANDNDWTDAVLVDYQQGPDGIFFIPSNVFDLSGNELVNFFSQPIQLTGITLLSNNVNSNRLARPGDIATLTFTATSALDSDPLITIAGNGPTTFDNSAAPNYTATYTFAGGEAEGIVPISITTLQGGLSTVITNTTDNPTNPSEITFDETPPGLDPISITSNNGFDTDFARVGDVVTLTITVNPNETLASGSATLAGVSNPTVTAGPGPFDFNFSRTLDGSEPEGIISFSVTVGDDAGNEATFTSTTDGSQVFFDRTAPDVNFIRRADANPENAGVNNGEVRFNVQFSETVFNVDVNDFDISSTNLIGTPTVASVNASTGTDFMVTVNGFDLIDNQPSGTLNLNFAPTFSIIDRANNVFSGVNLGEDETYTIINPESAEDITDLAAALPIGATSINLTWTNSAIDQVAYQHLIKLRENGTPNNPSDGTPEADDNDLASGSIGEMSFNVAHGVNNLNITGLNSATDYTIRIYPYTNDGGNINYRLSNPDQIMVETTTASETVIDTVSTAPTISSLSLSEPLATAVLTFTVEDDASDPNVDNAPTLLDQLTFTQGPTNDTDFNDWTNILGGAILVSGAEEINATINPTSLVFNLPNGNPTDIGFVADADGATSIKTFELRIYLQNLSSFTDIDGKALEFVLSNVATTANSSGLLNGYPPSDQITTGAGNNVIDVIATQFLFTSQPSSIEGINTIWATDPVVPIVQAVDINGIIDRSVSENFVVSGNSLSSGLTTISAPVGLNIIPSGNVRFINGVLNLADARFNSFGTGTLTITDIGGRGIASPATIIAVEVMHVEINQLLDGIITDIFPLNSGNSNVALFGFSLEAFNDDNTNPILESFNLRFRNQGGNPIDITNIFQNFRLFRSPDDAIDVIFSNDVNIAVGTVIDPETVEFTMLNEFVDDSGDNPGLTDQFYFIIADISVDADELTPSVTPFVESYDFTVNVGSIERVGTTTEFNYTFTDVRDPELDKANLVPQDGDITVDIATPFIIAFDESVISLDSTIFLRRQDLPASQFNIPLVIDTLSGLDPYSPDRRQVTFRWLHDHDNDPLTDPIDSLLTPEVNYFITVAEGNAANGTGFVDEAAAQNGYDGHSSNTVWNFRAADITPPVISTITLANIDDQGFSFSLSLDEPGEVFFIVADHTVGSFTPPSDNEVLSGSIINGFLASNNFTVDIPNQEYTTFINGLSSNQPFTVYVVARDLGGVTASVVPSNPDNTLGSSSAGIELIGADIAICQGESLPMTAPIVIKEGQNDDFNNGVGNIVLSIISTDNPITDAYVFNTSVLPDFSQSSAGFDAGSFSANFISNTTVVINYEITSSGSQRDFLIIDGFEFQLLEPSANASLRLLSQSGSTTFPGDLSSTDYITFNSFNSSANVTFNFEPNVSSIANDASPILIQENPALIVGQSSVFEGNGVFFDTSDQLYKFDPETAGIATHTITLTHIDQVGCVATGVEAITVFDNINSLIGLDRNICVVPGDNSVLIIEPIAEQFRLDTLSVSVMNIEEIDINLNTFEANITDTVLVAQPDGSYRFYPGLAAQDSVDFNIDPSQQSSVALKFISRYVDLNNLADTIVQEPVVIISGNPHIQDFSISNASLFSNNTTDFCADENEFEIQLEGSINRLVIESSQEVINLVNPSDFSPINDTGGSLDDSGTGNATVDPVIVRDSLGTGTFIYQYSITNLENTCTSTDTLLVNINPKPIADFQVVDNLGNSNPLGITGCVFEEDTQNQDSVLFYSTSRITDGTITRRNWDFDDALNATGDNPNLEQGETVAHRYIEQGFYNVGLSVTSEFGCVSDHFTQELVIGNNPTPSFVYSNIGLDENTILTIDETAINLDVTDIASIDWLIDERDGNVPISINLPGNQFELSRSFTSTGFKDIELTVTSNLNCNTSISDSLFIVPNVTVAQGSNYSATFENGDDGWVTWGTNNSWLIASAGGNTINAPSPTGGNSFWVTDTVQYSVNEESYVYSPIFDLTEFDRPLVTLDIFDHINQNDGAVLEYSLTGFGTTAENEESWTLVGDQESGINWYDQRDIANAAGLDNRTNVGWSVEEADWKNARNRLNSEVEGAQRVQFRVSFNSGGPDPRESDGFAFDNFFIGQRTRRVLVENFTNTEAQNAASQEQFLNNLTDGDNGGELIVMNYHTDFPNETQENTANRVDPSARALFYNISDVPRAVIDGNIFENDLFVNWGEREFELRTLSLADFNIDITETIQEGNINLNVEITPLLLDFEGEHISIIAAVIENDANDLNFIVRKLLPNAAGIRRAVSELSLNNSFNVDFSWAPTNVDNLGNLSAIVFIQDEESKEVYQAEIIPLPEVDRVTGLRSEDNTIFRLYPNPANNQLNIEFGEMLQEGVLKIYDNFGKLVLEKNISSDNMTLDLAPYSSGMYHIQLIKDDLVEQERLIIRHSDF